MFGLFKKTPPAFVDCVWVSDAARMNAIARLVSETPDTLVVAFFEASLAALRERLGASATLALASDIAPAFSPAPSGPAICVYEHHPLPVQNERLLTHLRGRSPAIPTFHVAMDEPLMHSFGGDRIVDMMQQLGLPPEEAITHPIIEKALASARIKIAKKVRLEQPAKSMAEWFARNVGQ